MNIEFLPEPELEFGESRHIDIKFGLMNYGPLNYAHALAPKQIRLGIVGSNETIEGVTTWLERCRSEVPAKPSKQPNLFPRFPGFDTDTCFRSSLILEQQLCRPIAARVLNDLCKLPERNKIVAQAVEIFLEEFRYLTQRTSVDVLVCAIPLELFNVMEEDDALEDDDQHSVNREAGNVPDLDFHNLLKAQALTLNRPIQIVLPATYDERKRLKQKARPDREKRPQDEATRAWNFHTAIYYKAGGTPWRLVRDPAQLATCFIGVSFYETLDKSSLMTSVAQVFNERGEGVIVRGDAAVVIKEDRQPHLRAEDAHKLLTDALNRYRDEHKTLPARIVLHRSSGCNADEIDGFTQAARSKDIEYLDIVSIAPSHTRLFRTGSYPPLRGTFVSLDDRTHILYTRGSVDFFETYPGMYIPRPRLFRCDATEQTPRFLAQEILGLTKMNWNNTQFDGADPITIRASRQVSAILKYIEKDGYVAPFYRFYM